MVVTGVARCHINQKFYEFFVLTCKIIFILTVSYWIVVLTDFTDRSELEIDDRDVSDDNNDADDDDYKWEPVSDKTFVGLDQENSELVAYVRKHVRSPAPRSEPYNLWKPEVEDFSQFGQSKYVEEILRGMKHGFFIEVGAADGEELSNTLMLERKLGWSGLLIEPEPAYYNMIISKNRKAYSINAGVSLDTVAKYAHYKPNLGLGRIDENAGNGVITIKTFPLYTMLSAIEVFHIDFFSLDVEGDEIKVLQTLPWDKITIRLMCVETNHVEGGAPAVINFMVRKGYIFLGLRDIDAWFGHPKLMKIE